MKQNEVQTERKIYFHFQIMNVEYKHTRRQSKEQLNLLFWIVSPVG